MNLSNKLSALGKRNEQLGQVEVSGELEKELGKFKSLSLEMIDPDPEQIRKEDNIGFSKEKLEEMAATIKKYGVRLPIYVQEEGGDRFKIVDGECRWRASKIAGKEKIPAFVIGKDVDAEALQIILNTHRTENTDEELSVKIWKYLDAGLTQVEIAEKIGKSQGLISQHKSVKKWPDFLKEAFFNERKVKEVPDGYELYLLYKKHGSAIEDWVRARDEITVTLIKGLKNIFKKKEKAIKEDNKEETVEVPVVSPAQNSPKKSFVENQGDEKRGISEIPSLGDDALSSPEWNEAEEKRETGSMSPSNPFIPEEPFSYKIKQEPVSKSAEVDKELHEGNPALRVPVSPVGDLPEDIEERISNPKIIVEFWGKRAILLFYKKSSDEHKVWIKYHQDGEEAEVDSEQVKLKGIFEGE